MTRRLPAATENLRALIRHWRRARERLQSRAIVDTVFQPHFDFLWAERRARQRPASAPGRAQAARGPKIATTAAGLKF